ncbi:MAG: M43 family zinc metalloprotease [Bacteroidota bacterium]
MVHHIRRFCGTIGGGFGSIGYINYNSPPSPQLGGGGDDVYIRMYVNVLRRAADLNSGQPDNAVFDAMDRLIDFYDDYGIHLIWDCQTSTVPVSDPAYFFPSQSPIASLPPNYCSFFNESSFKSDGINIFLGPDEATTTLAGRAENIPSIAFWTAGSFSINGEITPTIQTATLIHEMGHCLGLWHTYHGTVTEGGQDCNGDDQSDPTQCCELVQGDEDNRNNCGDYVADTGADPLRWSSADGSCDNIAWGDSPLPPFCAIYSPDDQTLRDENGDIYMPPVNNVMAATLESCRTQISAGQALRIKSIIATSPVLQNTIIGSISINSETVWSQTTLPDEHEQLIYIDGTLEIEPGAILTIGS